jgi:hypothetical protein
MSMTVKAIGEHWGAAVEDGLRRFTEPPRWLLAAADSRRVYDALTSHVHELRIGEVVVRDLEVKRLRIKAETWNVLYRVEVVDRAGDCRLVELCGDLLLPGWEAPGPGANGAPFGSPEWRTYLPELRLLLGTQPPDAALPALPVLTEPEPARALLEHAMRAGSPRLRDLRIASVKPKVMRYKPASRCTVLYQVDYVGGASEEDPPAPIVAKTYRGDKGRNAYEGMRSLWESGLRDRGVVSIAEPLAFIEDLNVLLQGPIKEEITLKELMRTTFAANTKDAFDDLERFMSKTATGLAALHGCGVQSGELVTWEDELGEVREVVDRLAVPVPALVGAARPLLERLEALAADHPAAEPGPSHRSFRPAQVLIADGEIGFIDFDGFCRAEPALDLGLFLATLHDIGLRALQDKAGNPSRINRDRVRRVREVNALRETFLTCYAAEMPLPAARVWLWEALHLLTGVLHCWTKVKFERLDYRLRLLADHLESFPDKLSSA